MMLPEYVSFCLEALENAGFPAYCVGGCVRDHLLGLIPNDYDICTAALPEQTEAVFAGHPLVLAGKKHGTVGVIFGKDVVEITTFRTEGAYLDNRHPEWVEFVPSVEEDLARRDFTVNAMAWSPKRGFADPFGGQKDLEQQILRAVGDPAERFREDSLRILRGLRFAVRFGLTIEETTWDAMVSEKHLMDNLARERVFIELCGLLPLEDYWTYIENAFYIIGLGICASYASKNDRHGKHEAITGLAAGMVALAFCNRENYYIGLDHSIVLIPITIYAAICISKGGTLDEDEEETASPNLA